MTGRHRPLPVITAGEPEQGAWCGVCLQPWRLVVPLYADGKEANRLEICPGCGSGHDRHAAYITPPAPHPVRVAPVPRRYRLAAAAHRWVCARRGLMSPGCAYRECLWPGLWRHLVTMQGDEGTWRYLFCRKSHRVNWESVA